MVRNTAIFFIYTKDLGRKREEGVAHVYEVENYIRENLGDFSSAKNIVGDKEMIKIYRSKLDELIRQASDNYIELMEKSKYSDEFREKAIRKRFKIR